MPVERERVLAAVNFLIESNEYARLIKEITDIIERWHTRPMVYADGLECLNALIDVGLESREAFDKLVELIEAKRRLIHEIKRVDYQRKLMQERRARQAKAIELHELVTGKKLSGPERVKFVRDLQARWRKERDAFIRAKGELSWEERNNAANEFWSQVDAKLEINLRDARQRLRPAASR
ncbi:MAG: hypothetical protein QJR07_10450 [Acetobacteraceae bacterium]|nr:hypothetical protein [Acetobacteraceae bacterium]